MNLSKPKNLSQYFKTKWQDDRVSDICKNVDIGKFNIHTLKPYSIKEKKMSKVLLKSVPELMLEGFEFGLNKFMSEDGTHELPLNYMKELGKVTTEIWDEIWIKEHIKEEKIYSLTSDFDFYVNRENNLEITLKDSIEFRNAEMFRKVKLKL